MLNDFAPQIVKAVHRAYLEAGADIIETNSFNGSPIVLEEYGIRQRARALARRSAELAKEAIEEWRGEKVREGGGNDFRPLVMGSMGPGTRSISVTGGVTFDEIEAAYYDYSAGLIEGGADLLVLETQQDTVNVKASLAGIRRAMRDLRRTLPVGLSVTIEPSGSMLAGQTIEALYHTFSGFDLAFLGLNCATGPAAMTDHIRALARISRFPVSVWPNAGLPDVDGHYCDGPDVFLDAIGRFAREGWVNIVGGCCGTTPDHIRALKEAVSRPEVKVRVPVGGSQNAEETDNAASAGNGLAGHYPALAGAEALVVEPDNKPVYIGERTNTIGSRKFKRLIGEGRIDEAAEIGREQQRSGALAIDLCTADPDREELTDFLAVLRPLLRKVRVPLLIDTTDTAIVEAALKTIGGKPAINSVNLEDGGARLRKVASLARDYGASLICGLIDDDPVQGMAVTVPRKLEIAGKIHNILCGGFGLPEADIIFDPLVFPAGTGDPNYLGSAEATIDGVRAVKERFPHCLTILGISNVSFGLPPAGREVVNSVFLYLCAKAGLDMAIVNTQGLKRYPTIPPEEVELAARLLMTGSSEAIAEFTAHFRTAKVSSSADEWAGLSADEQVSRAVVEARKTGLEANLTELLTRMGPLEVINGPLLKGMDEVGRLFADNRLIVAEVLESAEVMKTAVEFLKPHFPPGASGAVKGRVILATVKGDVHDIGKNLVDMILSNNGFEVINLGIKVPPETLIEAAREHQPDIIGLSGLLVRSAQQMVDTASDLRVAGIDLPVLVGGAALSKKFTLARIAPAYGGPVFYADEAMDGLALANQIVEPARRRVLEAEWKRLRDNEVNANANAKVNVDALARNGRESPGTGSAVQSRWLPTDVPVPPDKGEHILTNITIDDVWPYLNEQMLYGKHLGVKGITRKLLEGRDPKLLKLREHVEEVVKVAAAEGIYAPKAVYQWFRAVPDGEQIILNREDPENTEKDTAESSVISLLRSFSFPRQQGRAGISAVDWIRPPDEGGDHVCLFVTTAGIETSTKAAQMRKEGRLLASLILQAVAIELAEATAEWVHRRIRTEWGFPDDPALSVADLFRTKYRGIRLSFGYPACPQLEDQAPLFELLKPERIGVELTEGYMMHPEGSVTAVVFHHPAGQYYAL